MIVDHVLQNDWHLVAFSGDLQEGEVTGVVLLEQDKRLCCGLGFGTA